MRKKFKIIDASTGLPVKLQHGEMIVMNTDGIFFKISGIGVHYMGMRKLSNVVPQYDVVWKGETE